MEKNKNAQHIINRTLSGLQDPVPTYVGIELHPIRSMHLLIFFVLFEEELPMHFPVPFFDVLQGFVFFRVNSQLKLLSTTFF